MQQGVSFLLRMAQGALIGLGSVLPGISGGVLSVVFGVYQPIMAFLASPRETARRHGRLLLPVGIGAVLGFVGVANVLSALLERYPDPSVCLFVGLIAGMLPGLYRQAGSQGRDARANMAMGAAFIAVLALLAALKAIRVQIAPGFGSYLFCGFCLALSVIVPGMSFSTLLMPLGLYAPFVGGIGALDGRVLLPGGIGAAVTILLLARAAEWLMAHRYAVMMHGILGVVAAATLAIVPFAGIAAAPAVCFACLAAGAACALAFERFNARVKAR